MKYSLDDHWNLQGFHSFDVASDEVIVAAVVVEVDEAVVVVVAGVAVAAGEDVELVEDDEQSLESLDCFADYQDCCYSPLDH